MTEFRRYNVLEKVVSNTDDFITSVPKSQRKKFGQFFTTPSTAKFMARLFDIDFSKKHISILDAGAGTGILSVTLIEHIFQSGFTGKISLTCYENDAVVIPVLKSNLERLNTKYDVIFFIIQENYITSQTFGLDKSDCPHNSECYDYIIGNPPYRKMSKNAKESTVMREICHGAPNLYFMFLAMGIHNLKVGHELVYIIPRSWTSGAYFKKFRAYLLSQCVITDIHLFDSRNKVFSKESVLQETMILKLRKNLEKPQNIHISTSTTSDFSDLQKLDVPYDVVVSKNQFIYLVTSTHDISALEKIRKLPNSLPGIGHKMKTGLVVDFRTRDVLKDKIEDGAFPLLYAEHIKNGRVIWPIGKEGEVIKSDRASLIQENSDFLLVKRFTAKEEKRRLQCGIFLKEKFKHFLYLSTHNKVNFVKCDSPCLAYGLYVLFNSSLYDTYYRILNGSTQVNSTEVNQLPVPDKAVIEGMGRDLMNLDLSEASCNKALERWLAPIAS